MNGTYLLIFKTVSVARPKKTQETDMGFLRKITLLLIVSMGISFSIRVTGTLFPLIFKPVFMVKGTILFNAAFILIHVIFWLVFYREYILKTKKTLKEICMAAVIGSFAVSVIYLRKLPFVFGMTVQFPDFMIHPFYDAVVPLIGSVSHLVFFAAFKRALSDDEKPWLNRSVSAMIMGIGLFVFFHVMVLFNFIAFRQFEWLEHMPRGIAVGTVPLVIAAVLSMLYFYFRFYRFLDFENSTGK